MCKYIRVYIWMSVCMCVKKIYIFVDFCVFIFWITAFQYCKGWLWIMPNNIHFNWIMFHVKNISIFVLETNETFHFKWPYLWEILYAWKLAYPHYHTKMHEMYLSILVSILHLLKSTLKIENVLAYQYGSSRAIKLNRSERIGLFTMRKVRGLNSYPLSLIVFFTG